MCLSLEKGRKNSIRCSFPHFRGAPFFSKDPSTAANKRVRMSETEGEELQECTPSRRERQRTEGEGCICTKLVGRSKDSLDPGAKPVGVWSRCVEPWSNSCS